MMESNQSEHLVNEAVGDAQQTAATLLDDARELIVSNANDLTLKAQKLLDDVAEVVRAAALERPYAVLAIAAGTGFVLGALRGVNRRAGGHRRRATRDRD